MPVADLRLLLRRVTRLFNLSDEELRALEHLPFHMQAFEADQDVVREGDRPSRCFTLVDGFTATYKTTGDGKRQIHAFHLPGDIPDLQSLHLSVLDNSIQTLTPCRIGFIAHDALRHLCRTHPRLMEAFWRQTLIDAAIFREWMTNIGRRDAYSRLAHMLCEWFVRMRAVGLTDATMCELPMTQSELADAAGISTVHVNRILQELRGDGLIRLRGNRLDVPDWEQLAIAGDFDPAYLHENAGEDTP